MKAAGFPVAWPKFAAPITVPLRMYSVFFELYSRGFSLRATIARSSLSLPHYISTNAPVFSLRATTTFKAYSDVHIRLTMGNLDCSKAVPSNRIGIDLFENNPDWFFIPKLSLLLNSTIDRNRFPALKRSGESLKLFENFF